jgi:acyl-CoA reductase-like NAD-dependent aldehyde dehydrogenase
MVGVEETGSLDALLWRVRVAQSNWGARAPADRARALRSVRHRLVEIQHDAAETIAEETSRPVTEVAIQEIAATLGMLAFCEKHYPSWLQPTRFRYLRPGFWTKANAIHYDPIGVLAVIGPSNFPFSLAVMQASAALLCGNGVVLKPSERCPRTARLIRALYEGSELPEDVVQVVEGGEGEARRLITHAGIQKVIFTGSSETGARVAELCGRHFKPCVLELGGDGPAIVCDPVDLASAAGGILWSALYANGTSCIGTRRVLVPAGLRQPLIDALETHARALQRGAPLDPGTDIVPPQELRLNTSSDVGCPVDARRLQVEEYTSLDEAVEAVNRSAYGLSASVWCSNRTTARSVARRLRVGMVWVNDASVAMPHFPWGGVRRSGWGRLFGREALPELTNLKVISHDKSRRARRKFWWFPYSSNKLELTLAVSALAFGRHGWRAIPGLLRAAWRYLA